MVKTLPRRAAALTTLLIGGFALAACGNASPASDDGSDTVFPTQPVLVVHEFANIGGFGVDGSTLYWTIDSANGAVKKKALPDGAERVIVSDQVGATALVVDASGLYWVDFDPLAATPKATLMHLAPGASTASVLSSAFRFVWRLALDGRAVYVEDTFLTPEGNGGGLLFRMPKAGGEPTEIFRHTGQLWRMAVDESHVWAASQNLAPGLFRVPLTGGAAVRVTDDIQHPLAGSVALDDTSAFWSDSSGAVLSMPKTGGAITTVTTLSARSPFDRPYELALDGDDVYFTSEYGGIWRVPKTGGEPQALLSSGEDPTSSIQGLVVTATRVYFYVPRDQALKFIPK